MRFWAGPNHRDVWALALMGCNAATISSIQPGSEVDEPAAESSTSSNASARETFDANVQPLLEDQCVSCHGADRTGPPFLSGDMYTTIVGSSVIDFKAPGTSRILTKGEHTGPAWSSDHASTIRDWLDQEARERNAAGGDGQALTTERVPIEDGAVSFDLGSLGLRGTKLSFIAMRGESGLLMRDLEVIAGADGAKLVHPQIVVWRDSEPTPDAADRFSGIEVRVEALERGLVGSGMAQLADFPDGGALSFGFESVDAYAGSSGGDETDAPASGCSDLPSFQANARPALLTSCGACHGGTNQAATAAMDISSLADPANDGSEACNDVLARVNRASPNESVLLVNPDPGSNRVHPFKFLLPPQFTMFRDAVLRWINAEGQ